MNFTRKFFQAIADTVAILSSLWLFIILMFVGIFLLYVFTGYLMNPFLPFGLFFIYVLFCRSENYQGVGWIIAIIFTIIMLTAGKLPTPEEQAEIEKNKANEEYAKEQAKIIHTAKLVSFEDSEGNEFVREAEELEKDQEPQQRYQIKDGDKVSLTFILHVKDSEETEYPKASEVELDSYYVDTDSVYLSLYSLSDISYNENTGELTANSALNFTDYVSSGDGSFRLQLVSNADNLVGYKSHLTYFNIAYEDAYPEEEATIESSESSEKVTVPSEVPKALAEDVVITEGNVEDWEHILDDWEIEEAREQDGFYE